jgi:hypothetical protein
MGTARYFQDQQHCHQEGQFAVPFFTFVFNTFRSELLLSSPENNSMAPLNLTTKIRAINTEFTMDPLPNT